MTDTIEKTNIEGLKFLRSGKVRDIYDLGDLLLLVASDRISAFDVVMPDPIPDKGIILNHISNFWFEQLKDLVPNHIVNTDATAFPDECPKFADVLKTNIKALKNRSVIVKRSKPLRIECIVRGYISGTGWKDYLENGAICGITLAKGLRESEKLPEPIFTPSTKEEGGKHDRNIDFEEAKSIIGEDLANEVKRLSLKIYKLGSELALKRGIIIADTKFEFGLEDGKLLLIDEVLTPDSSRFWSKATYTPGGPQQSFDKQYLRDWLISIGWNQKPPAPTLPADVIAAIRKRYQEALDRITRP